MKTVLAVLVFCGAIGWAGALHGQTWVPVTINPQVGLVTTGGVSYAEYSWGMGGCLGVSNIGPLMVEGEDFSFDFKIQMETGVACPEDVFFEYATVVLGELPAGPYTLTTTSWGSPVSTNTFTVPANSGPMLQPIGFGKDGSFQMQLTGAPNVGYVLQYSTNLTDWASLSTNSAAGAGAPSTNAIVTTLTLTDTPPGEPGLRFYRTLIPQTVYVQQ